MQLRLRLPQQKMVFARKYFQGSHFSWKYIYIFSEKILWHVPHTRKIIFFFPIRSLPRTRSGHGLDRGSSGVKSERGPGRVSGRSRLGLGQVRSSLRRVSVKSWASPDGAPSRSRLCPGQVSAGSRASTGQVLAGSRQGPEKVPGGSRLCTGQVLAGSHASIWRVSVKS